MYVANGFPVSDIATPTLRWGDKLDRAVQVFVVVPINRPAHPATRTTQISKRQLRVFRSILERAKQRP